MSTTTTINISVTGIYPNKKKIKVKRMTTSSYAFNVTGITRFEPYQSTLCCRASATTQQFQSSRSSGDHVGVESCGRLRLNDYLKQSSDLLIKGGGGGGPPRWFSPLESSVSCLNNSSPLLLSLPGVDGNGLSLLLHHQRLGEIFDIWCLHIPTTDRTPFTDLVKFVESTVRSENTRFPNRPIYLVGESLGACIALAVAARTPNIDIVLVLANPATSFGKSQLQPLIPVLKILPNHIRPGLPYLMSLMTGVPSRMVTSTAAKGLPAHQTITDLSETVTLLFTYLSDLGDVLTVETVLWKLKLLESACAYSNSCLHSVSAQTLILSSGNDQLLPSLEEGERLRQILPKCQIRSFSDCGHALFLS